MRFQASLALVLVALAAGCAAKPSTIPLPFHGSSSTATKSAAPAAKLAAKPAPAATAAGAAAPVATAAAVATAAPVAAKAPVAAEAPKAILTDVVAKGSAFDAILANNFTLFAQLANASGVVPALNSTKLRATIFVPTDDAIKKAAAAFKVTPEELLANHLLVDRLVGYHIAPNTTLGSDTLADGKALSMARGDLKIVTDVQTDPSLRKIVTVVGDHNKANLVQGDITAGNVVIHVVDTVLLPYDVYPTIKAALASRDIVRPVHDLMSNDKALAAAMADPKTSVTLFAPTAGAFKALEASPGAKALLSNPTVVGHILSYHAVPGARLLPRGFKDGEKVDTLFKGNALTIKKVKGPDGLGVVQVLSDAPDAKPVEVKKMNVIAGNSIIHVVDGVLVPAKP